MFLILNCKIILENLLQDYQNHLLEKLIFRMKFQYKKIIYQLIKMIIMKKEIEDFVLSPD